RPPGERDARRSAAAAPGAGRTGARRSGAGRPRRHAERPLRRQPAARRHGASPRRGPFHAASAERSVDGAAPGDRELGGAAGAIRSTPSARARARRPATEGSGWRARLAARHWPGGPADQPPGSASRRGDAMTALFRALAILAAVLLAPAAAQAHKPSDSYLGLRITDSGVDGEWKIALRDLDFAIGLDSDD